jgi:hypothetical protein
MIATELREGQVIEFAGGWFAKVTEKIRDDVVFVEAITKCSYRHHAFGIEHPIWETAKVVEMKEPESAHERRT